MTDLPPPDVKDSAGRMRRLVLALLLGGGAAALVFLVADRVAKPDELAQTGYYARGAYRFVGYVTGLAGAAVFTVALVVQNHLAKKKWRASLVAHARTVQR